MQGRTNCVLHKHRKWKHVDANKGPDSVQNESSWYYSEHFVYAACSDSHVCAIMNLGNIITGDVLRYLHAPRPLVHRQFCTPRSADDSRSVVNLLDTSSEDNSIPSV
jgi:hypothetical protein